MGTSFLCSNFSSLPSSPAIKSLLIPSPSSKFPDQSLRISLLLETGFYRSRSDASLKSRFQPQRRSFTACLDRLPDAEFAIKFKEFDRRFHIPGEDHRSDGLSKSSLTEDFSETKRSSRFRCFESAESPWAAEEDEIALRASIERRANSIDLPFSLRILKRKRQLQEELPGARESASCSVKNAFSSLVFMIRELQSYALQMTESLVYRNLQEILDQVHEEMHASFVWLFQQIFSHTPALMVSVMILLANFTVHSMGYSTAIAVAAAPSTALTETLSAVESRDEQKLFDTSSAVKTLLVSGNPASVEGAGGGGGKVAQPVAGPTDEGDERPEKLQEPRSDRYKRILPEDARMELKPEEVGIWNSMVEEAARMSAEVGEETLDDVTVRMLVSPVTVAMEPDYECYVQTELLYQRAVSEEPDNPLLLCNFAQFLYLATRNLDRAEEYFKRATEIEPPDAESLLQYAIFLWKARKDPGAAEEMFVRAIDAEPHNMFHASHYSGFLFQTGGSDTCVIPC